ncbi:hypothetical protein ASF23_11805 [Curtobacterium sp. Leaf261]|nr:hypothetical protein ASF23_11805 [Curtobacterium sp. Leaf261]
MVDVETTGLSPRRDRIIELAIVRLDAAGVVVDESVGRFDPEGPVGATHIHGITQADVDGKPRFADVAPSIVAGIAGLPVVAHNAKFDLAFLRNELEAAGWDVPWVDGYCTLEASWSYLPEMDRRRLVDCCWASGVALDDAHSALGDARATAGLFRSYLRANGGPDRAMVQAQDSARSTNWPSSPTRTPLSPSDRSWDQRPAPIRFSRSRPTMPPLMKQLTALTLLEVIDEGAPVGTTAYLELLFDALEDGDISETESDALAEVRADYDLTAADVTAAHEALLLALAHRAVDDGHVSHEERRELRSVASLLGVPDGTVKAVLNRADAARHARLSAGLGPLPDPWPHGVPLRVGDRIAFTGCEERQRERLERRAEELGVRVSGAVSGRTTMLITDGSFSGGKLARSLELGTRTVHPDVFEVLLRHLQPASAIGMMPAPSVTAPTAISSRSGAQDEIGRPSPSAIRAWAVAQGYEVGVRGRLPREVLDAYAKAV